LPSGKRVPLMIGNFQGHSKLREHPDHKVVDHCLGCELRCHNHGKRENFMSIPDWCPHNNIKPGEPGERRDDMFEQYRKKGIAEMRPYVVGEDMSGISVSAEDTLEEGGMIARNPENHKDQWYVGKEFFLKNYEEVKDEA